MRDRKILTVDEPRIIADASRVGQRVWSEVQKAGPIKVPCLPRLQQGFGNGTWGLFLPFAFCLLPSAFCLLPSA